MWYLILAFLLLIYWLSHTLLSSLGTVGAFIINPILWISIAIVTLLIAYRDGLNIIKYIRARRWYLGKNPIHAGFLIGGFQVSILILVGIVAGFGKSPYAFTPVAILTNLFYVASFLVGIEISRAYLINTAISIKRKRLNLIILSTTLLFMIIQISPDQFTLLNFAEPVDSLEFIGKTMITLLSMNLLASYLSYLGGASAAIGYTGTLLAFQWFSPILPDLHWTISALVGTIAPAIGFVVLQNSFSTSQERKQKPHKRRKSSDSASWTVVAIISLLIVFFSFGYLGVKPTVIYSGSMQPTLKVGDIAIIDDVDIESIKEGDLIQYVGYDNVSLIIHRVVNIQQQENQNVFITKGDANDDPDSMPVTPNRITGKSVFTIPGIGWIQIFFKSLFKNIGVPIN